MPNKPLIVASKQRNYLLFGQQGQVARRNATEGVPYSAELNGALVHDLKDPAAGFVALLLLVVVAFTDVRPVGDKHTTVGAVFAVHAAEPGVLREGEIGSVFSDVAAAVRLERVAVEALAVDVEHKGVAAIFGGPVVTQIDHAADVGVAAAKIIVCRAAAGGRPVAAGPVLMVGAAFHEAIDVWVRVLAEHADVVTAGHDVKNVFDDTVGDEQF